MSRLPRFAPVLCIVLAQAALAADDSEPKLTIPDLVLSLEQLQDAAAGGNAEAGALQRRMLGQISALLVTQQATTLPDDRTLRAAIAYVLSGGRPQDVEVLLKATPENVPLRWLLKGAVHYARGEKEQALKAFHPFSPERLPLSIGGRIALAEATLLPDAESAEKIRLLEFAARLMPGTLVEEASLRRLNAIAAATGEAAGFQKTAERYVERFATSIYAADFIDGYVKQVVALEDKHTPVDRMAFERLLNRFKPERRRAAYLAAARQATVRGLADFALFSASRARRLAPEDSDDWHYATLYDAAILITGPDYEVARGLLDAIDPRRLDAEGRALLAASRRIADNLRNPSVVLADTGPGSPKDLTLLPSDQAALAVKAAKALEAANSLLQGTPP
jgi:chemotaxis protein MotC